MTKLILGTAQFGIPNYGVKHDGQPSPREIEKIARVAWDGGIRVIHYSWQYRFDYIDIFDDFSMILKDQDNPHFFKFKDKIGYSFYHPDRFMFPFLDVDILQIPVNILDNRFLKPQFSFKGYEIHARSVFLQGLLLMEDPPSWIKINERAIIKSFHQYCKILGLQYYEASLGWVLGLKDIDHVIVGVNSAEQLKQLLAVKPLQWEYDFSITDENVLDPRRWPV